MMAFRPLPAATRSTRPRRLFWLFASLGLGAVAITITLAEGLPERLPGVALGSTVLLHSERGAALLGLALAAATLLINAAEGRLPSETSTSGFGYEARLLDDSSDALQELQGQVADLELMLADVTERIDDPDRRM